MGNISKPSIPKGTRDFSPLEMARRNYIFDTIKNIFELHGFKQIETPAMENLSTLLGKYGEEGDKLLFKILNSGRFINNIPSSEFVADNSNILSNKICEKGLRYDLTVPFARYVVQHHNEIVFPFRRYQIQPVWRADKPQKGRYREFYQCDADIVGSNSILNEYELIYIADKIFSKLNIPVTIKINNRKILAGIAEIIQETDKITEITTAIDKLEKIGLIAVNNELKERGLNEKSIENLQPLFSLHKYTNQKKLQHIAEWLKLSAIGIKGVEEMTELLSYTQNSSLNNEIEIDFSLARGLNYYTGTIIEIKAKNISIGSLSGGGRYDNLTGVFGLPNISGVGISFGADRIYDVLEYLKAFPISLDIATQLLFINFGKQTISYILPIAEELRNNQVRVEIYPDEVKIKKQFSYANDNRIPWVAITGEDEIMQNKITLKNMQTGSQQSIPYQKFSNFFLKNYDNK